jgi:hypothetical protein
VERHDIDQKLMQAFTASDAMVQVLGGLIQICRTNHRHDMAERLETELGQFRRRIAHQREAWASVNERDE